MMAIQFKHIGIHVYDLDGMTRFYQNMFGLVVSDYSVEDNLQIVFMTGSPDDHHQVVLIGGREPGILSKHLLNQMSYKADGLDEILEVYRKAKELGLDDVETVTHGNSWSCYFRDPEGNRQEVYCDTPWYITQPHLTFLDFDKSAADIRADTEALVRADPSFRPRDEWKSEIRAKITAALAARK